MPTPARVSQCSKVMMMKRMDNKVTFIKKVGYTDLEVLVFRGFICKRDKGEKYKIRNCILLQTSII